MKAPELLNGLPVVAVTVDGTLGYVSPLTRSEYPGIEDRIISEVLPQYRSGKSAVVVELNAEFGAEKLSYQCQGYPAAAGGVTFVVQKLKSESSDKSVHLEALGEIAAGVAHEMNTPLQYVNDNTQFVADSVQTLLKIVADVRQSRGAAEDGGAAELDQEVEFLTTELPRALSQSLEGLAQVAEIVQALKEFSHQSKDKQTMQVNGVVRRAATLSKNEWKYCAKLELNLDESLPEISVVGGELCQSVVNLMVNASHAIIEAQRLGKTGGRLIVSTSRYGDGIRISVGDDGTGIPDEIKQRIFEPFFTTKALGKGTGQGLTQVRNCVEELHGGSVSVESTVGNGATFHIDLPAK